MVIWFDVTTESFGRMEVPPVAVKGGRRRRYIMTQSLLTKFEDQFLCLVLVWVSRRNNRHFDIWVMRQYGVTESWAKESTFGPLDDTMDCTQVLGIGRFCNNHVGGMFLQDTDEMNKLFLCDPATSRVYNLGVAWV
uniref:F-box protein n=1 Tax=Kalanchoe fedtschenkoi TaxID=63787 RepID=A0A7N0UDC5_KALFE